MFLHNFLHGRPVIWLDHESGTTRKATPAEIPEDAALADLEVLKGIYLEEDDGLVFYKYWTQDGRFFFRTSTGTLIEIDKEKYAEIIPACDVAGRAIAGISEFRILARNGQLLFSHFYPSGKYFELYMMDFSFPSPELEDWDFFIALKGSFEYMRERTEVNSTQGPQLISSVGGGESCPREGYWFTPASPNSRRLFRVGEVMPELDKDWGATYWQWDQNQEPNSQKNA